MRQRFLMFGALALCILAGTVIGLRSRGSRGQSYNKAFFEGMDLAARHSAEAVVPVLVRLVHPRSMVDVGSGNGFWAKAFMDNGVPDVVAIDGPWVEKSDLKVPAEKFVVRDLSNPLQLDRTFDMVLCLETAEHLHPERADGFIADLVKLAPVVVFSAAIPGQGGTMHYNEEWPGYWAARFARNSYVAIDALRPALWNNDDISAMYRQNMVLYVRKDYLETRVDLKGLPSFPAGEILPLVHPEVYRNGVIGAAYASRWQTKVKRFLGIE